MITGPMARPSSPSVRFTAFDAPMITSIAKGTQSTPRFTTHPLRKGMARTGVQFAADCQVTIWSRAAARRIWQPNFVRAGRPFLVRTLRRSSHTPMAPKPAVASTATHT